MLARVPDRLPRIVNACQAKAAMQSSFSAANRSPEGSTWEAINGLGSVIAYAASR